MTPPLAGLRGSSKSWTWTPPLAGPRSWLTWDEALGPSSSSSVSPNGQATVLRPLIRLFFLDWLWPLFKCFHRMWTWSAVRAEPASFNCSATFLKRSPFLVFLPSMYFKMFSAFSCASMSAVSSSFQKWAYLGASATLVHRCFTRDWFLLLGMFLFRVNQQRERSWVCLVVVR